MGFSAWNILKNGLTGNRGWGPHWRDPEPKPSYDVIIIGGGGHGLSTAGNSEFYSHSLKLWEGLEQELNYNVMMSQRGQVLLAHSDGQMDAFARRGNAMRMQGDDAELFDRQGIRKLLPYLNHEDPRFPIYGGLMQWRAGTARHDAVAWGYARGADQRGVDIIQNCEVTGFRIEQGQIKGVETSRGYIGAGKVGMCAAGRSSQVAQMAGLRLPIESHVLQAFVSEGLKPILPSVVSFGMGHFYISQSDKGGLVFGGDLDGYNSYAQRGIIDKTPVAGLFFNGGWCYGGFKAVPASGHAFAHLLGTGNHSEHASKFLLNRFETGALLDEEGTGAQPNLH